MNSEKQSENTIFGLKVSPGFMHCAIVNPSAYLDIHQHYKSAFPKVIQDISSHREPARDCCMFVIWFVFLHHTIQCTHSRISIHSSYRPLRKREQNVSRKEFFYDASQHQERDEITEDTCQTTFRNSNLDCVVIVLLQQREGVAEILYRAILQ